MGEVGLCYCTAEESCGRTALRAEYTNCQVKELGWSWGQNSSLAFSESVKACPGDRGVRNSAAKECVGKLLIM